MLRKLSQEEQAKERKVAEGQRRVRILKGEREGRIAWGGGNRMHGEVCSSATTAFVCVTVRVEQRVRREEKLSICCLTDKKPERWLGG